MINLFLAFVLTMAAGVAALRLWRRADKRAERAAWSRLAAMPSTLPERFDVAILSDLPEPAQRYFRFVIAPGARLSTISEVDMDGELSLGSRDNPRYQPMRAWQVLCPPQGLVWRVEVGRSLMHVVGSDGIEEDSSWSRFWLFGLVP
jgi:hypothetical protein